VPISAGGTHQIEIRTVFIETGLASAVFSDTFTINAAPTNPLEISLTPIDEDVPDGGNSGVLIATLVTESGSTDTDGDLLGIAVTAVENANGLWQYSTDGGAVWHNLSFVSAIAGRLLASEHRLRFIPNPDFNSLVAASPALTFKVWDQTAGTSGGTADTTISNGFSLMTAEVSQPVTAINDEQIIAVNAGLIVDRGGSAAFTPAILEGTDVDDLPDDLVYIITSGPTFGTILLGGIGRRIYTAAHQRRPRELPTRRQREFRGQFRFCYG
jgi:hypothetical protein